ncbi:MAG: GNAT family N-acetyltransferase [Methylophilus sp.]|jgi:predicted GNAT family N-acyltransferase
MSQNYRMIECHWHSEFQAKLKIVREQVFILEQSVPVALEWDEHDATAIHLLALDAQEQAIACARILITNGSIGRMAVMPAWRGLGVGSALLDKAVAICKAHAIGNISLSAQTHALGFYQKAGFKVSSAPYLDVDIWHVDMQLEV